MRNVLTGLADKRWLGFGVFALLLSGAFLPVLVELAKLSCTSDLESYIPLIPCISAYFLFAERGLFPASTLRSRCLAAIPLGASFVFLALNWLPTPWNSDAAGLLFFPTLAYVTGLLGGFVFFFGGTALRIASFPFFFLYLMTPIPEPAVHWLSVALQYCTAEATDVMFMMTGTPFFREGLNFMLPGLSIQIAEECSGIRSSLVLFIVALVAGYALLGKSWTRVALVLVVFPLGVLRNAFRVVTLSLLTIHVDRGIINGPLHHKGGPIFFVLSFVVFLGILLLLRRCERGKRTPCVRHAFGPADGPMAERGERKGERIP